MRVDIHVHLHSEPAGATVDQKLDDILAQLGALAVLVMNMDAATSESLKKLNEAVAEETTVEASVEALLVGLAKQIEDLKAATSDPAVIAAIDAATEIVRHNNTAASAAVVANTGA